MQKGKSMDKSSKTENKRDTVNTKRKDMFAQLSMAITVIVILHRKNCLLLQIQYR